MGLEHLINDPRFHDYVARKDNYKELIRILDETFATKTRDEWMPLLQKEGVIWGIVNTLADLPNDPQVIANDYIVDFDHEILGKMKYVGLPIKLSETPAISVRSRAPMLGEHTEEVLIDLLGYSWEDIARLKDMEVI